MKAWYAALMLVPAVLRAQVPDTLPIDTDRPDFTDGTHTLARGRLQFEAGYTYQRARGDDATALSSFPELLVRVGILQRAELRLGENYLIESPGGGLPNTTGFDDLFIGTKVALTEGHGWLPSLSAEAKVNLPTGSAAIGAGRALPGGALLLGWEAAGPWSAGVEGFVTEVADKSALGIASLSVQYQASTHWQLYGELFSQQPLSSAAPNTTYLNGGVMLLLSQNVQLDARLGVGLNHDADRYFTGFGVAVRR
ncbi:MAG TPA: transporter [Gemmatimonadales bacterium]|jgi:hypothetical protein